MKKLIFSVLFLSAILMQPVFAQQAPVLELFHGRDCPHCQAELEWLPQLEAMYPGLVINAKEVWYDAANQEAFNQRMSELGLEASGVPTNVIGDEVVVGFDRDAILELMVKNYGEPISLDMTPTEATTETSATSTEMKEKSWFEKLLVWLFGKKEVDKDSDEAPLVAKAGQVQVGQVVPDFTADVLLADDSTAEWSLSDARGQWTLLFFYPKDRTFVCPTEIREMVAAKAEFERLGVKVILASADTLESHSTWRADVGGADLTYDWMSDTDNEVSKLLGIYDAVNDLPLRGTFLIDPAGVLQFEMTSNSLVGRNIDEIVRIAEANQTGELCPASWQPGEETLGEEK